MLNILVAVIAVLLVAGISTGAYMWFLIPSPHDHVE
jgi:hypothetical protein